MTRIGLDSNILAYLAGVSRVPEDDAKIDRVREIIRRLSKTASLVAPTQALGELFVVLRRSGATAADARAILLEFTEAFATPPSEARTAIAATDLVVDHKLQYWDALILMAAAEAGCSLLLSEDMQDGFLVRGLTVINPLIHVQPKLDHLIDGAP